MSSVNRAASPDLTVHEHPHERVVELAGQRDGAREELGGVVVVAAPQRPVARYVEQVGEVVGVPRLLEQRRGPVDARPQLAPIAGRQRPGVRRHGDLPRIARGARARLRLIRERAREVEAAVEGLLDGTRPEHVRADRGAGQGRRERVGLLQDRAAARPCVRAPTAPGSW